MSTPSWWSEVLAASHQLAAADRRTVARWRGDADADAEAADDVPPLTIRLGYLAQAFAAHSAELTEQQRVQMLAVLERVLATGSDPERDAVATGFFEALLAEWDKGFDLRQVWPLLGPESRAYCLSWNAFLGIESPDWMRRT
jgi:hypothetical protein